MNNTLTYRNGDGERQILSGCNFYQDKAGRYWLWSEQIRGNLACRIAERDDCLIAALSMALFIIQLRDNRITELQQIADLAYQFADAVKPDEPETK